MSWFAGHPREEIEWFPTIDEKKCLKCGICMNCGRDVYQWTDTGPVVARPYSCVVGCSTCANLCQGEAIRFQELSGLRRLYRERGVWRAVRKQMLIDGKIWDHCMVKKGDI